MSLPDFTRASISGRRRSLIDSLVAFSVLTRNSYSPVSGASNDPCQVTRNSCENGLNNLKGTSSSGALCHFFATSLRASCSGIGLLVPNWKLIS